MEDEERDEGEAAEEGEAEGFAEDLAGLLSLSEPKMRLNMLIWQSGFEGKSFGIPDRYSTWRKSASERHELRDQTERVQIVPKTVGIICKVTR